MASSLSNLVDNLAEGIHEVTCQDCNCFLEYERVKDNLIKYKCLSYNKTYSNKIDEKVERLGKSAFRFFNNDLINFCFQEKVFIFMNIWMNVKSLIKHYCLEKKIVTVT